MSHWGPLQDAWGDVGQPASADDRTLLRQVAKRVDERGIARLLAMITSGRCDPWLATQVLVAFGVRGTAASIQGIADYEEWAVARGTRVRPSWLDQSRERDRWLVRDPTGRWWGLHSWDAWSPTSLWLTWSDDGATWSPACHVGSDMPADDLWRLLAANGEAALPQFDLACTDEEIVTRLHEYLDRTVVEEPSSMPSARVTAAPPRRRPPVRASAIAQAVWLVLLATHDDAAPLLVKEGNILSRAPLRGALGARIARTDMVDTWRNVFLRRVGRDQPAFAQRELVIYHGPLAAQGYNVVVELKHNRWVATSAELRWLA